MPEVLQTLPLPPIPTIQQLVFLGLALFVAVSALITVGARNLFHSALGLVATLFGVAGLYFLMEAEFVGVSQILVYVGAIATLIAFAEGRKHNSADPGFQGNDIDLVMKRSSDGGRTWSRMVVVEDPGERWSAANPATLLDRRTGRVLVFYVRCQPDRSSATARGRISSS